MEQKNYIAVLIEYYHSVVDSLLTITNLLLVLLSADIFNQDEEWITFQAKKKERNKQVCVGSMFLILLARPMKIFIFKSGRWAGVTYTRMTIKALPVQNVCVP